MKRWIAFIIALGLCAAAAVAEDLVTTGPAELRKGPGEDYRVVGQVGEDTRLSYDRTAQDREDTLWYRVRIGGRTGWVSSHFAQREAAPAREQVTVTSDAKLRSGPGEGYASRLVVEAGTTLACEGIAEDEDETLWYRVTCSGKGGWICSRYAERGAVSVTGSVTTTGGADLRSGAGRRYSSRAVIPAGVRLDYDRMERDDQGVLWYRVRHGQARGWVSSLYVAQDEGAPAANRRILTTGAAQLHLGPGREYASVAAIEQGAVLVYDRAEPDRDGLTWYHVAYDGMKGWVSSRCATEY